MQRRKDDRKIFKVCKNILRWIVIKKLNTCLLFTFTYFVSIESVTVNFLADQIKDRGNLDVKACPRI